MVHVQVSPQLKELLAVFSSSEPTTETVPVDTVRRTVAELRKRVRVDSNDGTNQVAAASGDPTAPQQPPGPWLHELLEGSQLQIPEEIQLVFQKPPKQRSPELVARLQKLQAAMDNREYAKMVRGITRQQQHEADREELGTYFGQVGIAVNILVTIITLFIFGYFVGSRWWHYDQAKSVVCGLFCGILALLVESWLFVAKASMVDKMADRRHRRQETDPSFPTSYKPLSFEATPMERHAALVYS